MQASRYTFFEKQAFSLVELSIVLVILGLLVGGVLSGQSLIRAAELRSVASEYNRYDAAVLSFRDKYFSLPGDMTNATAFWGTQGGGCTVAATSTATCDGDGDGRIDRPEMYRLWQHLANAGLIEGIYSGVPVAATCCGATIGVNAPRSKLTKAGWLVSSSWTGAGSNYNTSWNNPPSGYAHWFSLGGDALANSWLTYPVLVGADAWNIDTKLDDGKPMIGKITIGWDSSGSISWALCTTTQIAATAAYTLTSSAVACYLNMGL